MANPKGRFANRKCARPNPLAFEAFNPLQNCFPKKKMVALLSYEHNAGL
jgi:tRNA (Thr-GGU) A37 N-methylase